MIKWIYFKTDLKKLIREPMMVMLFVLPLFLAIIFKLLLMFLVPWLSSLIGFDAAQNAHYILSCVLILNPGMLGIVMGFMMLDDKDGNITQLMSVTPLGLSGYIIMRLAFVFLSTVIYTLYTYAVLGLYLIPIVTLLYITLLLSLYGSMIGMILFSVATDKVKGLTYAKPLNLMFIFALANLIEIPWVQILASLFPTYWITKIISQPHNLFVLLAGGAVHLIWFGFCLYRYKRLQR